MKKKLLIITSLVAALSSSAAFAKTEGNYATLSVLRSSVENKYKNQPPAPITGIDKSKDNAIGIGLDYKHAFNYNNFFIAPGAFLEQIGSKAKDEDGNKVNINYRYGVKADLGYDITDNFAVYFTNGFGSVNYKVTDDVETKKGNKINYFYGLGLGYNLNKELAFNLEYNTQKADLKTPYLPHCDKLDSKIDVIKLGVSYRF